MRAVQITRFGGPEVLETVDVPEPTPGPGQQLYDVSTAGINYADTHHSEASRVGGCFFRLVCLLERPQVGTIGPDRGDRSARDRSGAVIQQVCISLTVPLP